MAHTSCFVDDLWKEFEQNELSHSTAHYLMAIENLIREKGYARLVDISKRLNIKPSSCSSRIKVLKKQDFIVEDENKFFTLSVVGSEKVSLISNNRHVIRDFFIRFLEVSEQQARIDACKIEHLMSKEVVTRLSNFLKVCENSKEGRCPYRERPNVKKCK